MRSPTHTGFLRTAAALFACALGLACLPALAATGYAFTDSACVNSKAFGSAQQTCKPLGASPIVAGATANVFVTALSAGGVPTQLSGVADTTVALTFALNCINPVSNAGVQASYAAVVLPLCAPNGAVPANWSTSVNMLFKAKAPSIDVGASFSYADVGMVQLFLRESSNPPIGSAPFVVKPDSLAITSVTRSADGFVNPKTTSSAGAGFARAGEAITINAVALTTTGAVAPNFGSEGVRLSLNVARGGDQDVQAAMAVVPTIVPPPVVDGFTTVVGGVFSGTGFASSDAGILAVSPRLSNNDYLGAGAPSSSATTIIGRFIPDHFDTLTTNSMNCLPHMGCPLKPGPGKTEKDSAAAYSAQPFAVTVKPMDTKGNLLKNFNGALGRQITLEAYSAAGGPTANPSGGTLTGNMIPVTALVSGAIPATPVYTLPLPYSRFFAPTPQRSAKSTAPTPIYLRASVTENVAGGNVAVTSLRPSSGSVEGDVTIISGRLALENPYGSEIQKMPVKAEAQYWASTGRWERSASDQISTLQSSGINFANCIKISPCSAAPTDPLGVSSPGSLVMKDGFVTFWLKAPGVVGSAEFQMNNPSWLPSVVSRAVFGVYKGGPVIYMREMY